MARPRTTPSKTLAKVHEANHAVEPITNGPDAEYETQTVSDEYRHHLSIVGLLDHGHALSTAEMKIMEARGLKGQARRGKIAEAIHALRFADWQAATTAVAMLIALPAWLGVMARCGGLI